jgi:hypothetical protein
MVAAVPQIEGLTVENMLELAKTSQNALRHIPDERDWDGLSRKWLADILFTVEKAKFERAIKDAVKARKDRLEVKNDMLVDMRPEFAQAFQNSMSFSCKLELLTLYLFSGERPGIHVDEGQLQEEENQIRIGGGEAGGGSHARGHTRLPHRGQAAEAGAR